MRRAASADDPTGALPLGPMATPTMCQLSMSPASPPDALLRPSLALRDGHGVQVEDICPRADLRDAFLSPESPCRVSQRGIAARSEVGHPDIAALGQSLRRRGSSARVHSRAHPRPATPDTPLRGLAQPVSQALPTTALCLARPSPSESSSISDARRTADSSSCPSPPRPSARPQLLQPLSCFYMFGGCRG